MLLLVLLYIFGLSLTGKIRASGVLLLVRFLELICLIVYVVYFFNDTATTEIYTLSLHDALPI